MPRKSMAIATLALMAAYVPAAQAGIRCGTELVDEGDSVVKLLDACGEPTFGDPGFYMGTDEWTYNFGPNEFMMRVVIRDGRVERIEELGRGMVDPLEEVQEDDEVIID